MREETGLNIRRLINDDQFLDDENRNIRMYIILGVPDTTTLQPTVQEEIQVGYLDDEREWTYVECIGWGIEYIVHLVKDVVFFWGVKQSNIPSHMFCVAGCPVVYVGVPAKSPSKSRKRPRSFLAQ